MHGAGEAGVYLVVVGICGLVCDFDGFNLARQNGLDAFNNIIDLTTPSARKYAILRGTHLALCGEDNGHVAGRSVWT
jgi:hypothetical protein